MPTPIASKSVPPRDPYARASAPSAQAAEVFLERCVWGVVRLMAPSGRKTVTMNDLVGALKHHPCPESMQFFVGMRSSHPPPLPLAPSKVPDADGD